MSSFPDRVVSSVILAAGAVIAAVVLSNSLRDMKRGDRYVSVKGMVERNVAADLATWQFKTKVSGDDLAQTHQGLQKNLEAITQFLTARGIGKDEMELSGIRVVDRQAAEYGNSQPGQQRYIVEGGVNLRTPNVELVMKISQMMSDLVQAGVALSSDNPCTGMPNYSFTKFNDVKQEMLADATQNARLSAQEFAKNSDSKVGQIRQANQGVFTISSRDGGEADQSGCSGSTDMNKTIRVVTTVDYYLEN